MQFKFEKILSEYTISTPDEKFGIELEIDHHNNKITVTPRGEKAEFRFTNANPDTVKEIAFLLLHAAAIARVELTNGQT